MSNNIPSVFNKRRKSNRTRTLEESDYQVSVQTEQQLHEALQPFKKMNLREISYRFLVDAGQNNNSYGKKIEESDWNEPNNSNRYFDVWRNQHTYILTGDELEYIPKQFKEELRIKAQSTELWNRPALFLQDLDDQSYLCRRGFQSGDAILEMESVEQFIHCIKSTKAGDTLKFSVDRPLEIRKLLLIGMEQIKKRVILDEKLVANIDDVDYGGFLPVDISGMCAKQHHWVDNLIKRRLDARRDGLFVVWDINGKTFKFNVWTGTIEQT